MDTFDLEERQATAAIVGFFGLCILVPVLVLAGSGIAMGWAAVFGVHDLHGTIWGWLSTKGHDAQGRTVWNVGSVVWKYYLGVVSTYIVYQIGELLHGGFKAFRGALT